MLRNLKYYQNRERDVLEQITMIEAYNLEKEAADKIDSLMGWVVNMLMVYFSAFEIIIPDFKILYRIKQPPSNEVNALISFTNMMCYTLCLDAIYHTQLDPTISYLHDPGYRRYSLALDVSEIFKPILVDRLIFSLLNKKILSEKDFEKKMNYCLLNHSGRKKVLRSWEERLNQTIKHRKLNKHVSYKHLVKLEVYKLIKHIMQIEPYRPFKAWW